MIRPFLTALLLLLIIQPPISGASWSTVLKKNGGNVVAKETGAAVESATQRQLRESAERSYINNVPQQVPQRRAPSYDISPDGKVTEVRVITKRLPPNVRNTLKYIKVTGNAPPGHKGGRVFKNDGRGGGQQLPKNDGSGNAIKYKEYDVNPYKKGVDRGAGRIVQGSDGSSYYTNDHYKTFKLIDRLP